MKSLGLEQYNSAVDYSCPKQLFIEVCDLNLLDIVIEHRLSDRHYTDGIYTFSKTNIKSDFSIYQNQRLLILLNSNYSSEMGNLPNLYLCRLIILKTVNLIKVIPVLDTDQIKISLSGSFFYNNNKISVIGLSAVYEVKSEEIYTNGDFLHYLAENFENLIQKDFSTILKFEI